MTYQSKSVADSTANASPASVSPFNMKKNWKGAPMNGDASSVIASVKQDQQKYIESCVEDQVNLEEFELNPSNENRGAVRCDVYAEDVQDDLLIAIMKSMMIMGNIPLTPKEICKCISHYQLATFTTSAPHSIVSSRISHHFKRVAEHPDRRPLFGKMLTVAPPSSPCTHRIKDLILSAGERGEKKMRYYLNQLKTKMAPMGFNTPFKERNPGPKSCKSKRSKPPSNLSMDAPQLTHDLLHNPTLSPASFSPLALLPSPFLSVPPTPDTFNTAFLSAAAALSPAAALLFSQTSSLLPTPTPSPVLQASSTEPVIIDNKDSKEQQEEDDEASESESEYSGDDSVQVKRRRLKPRHAKNVSLHTSKKKKKSESGSSVEEDSHEEEGGHRRKRTAAIAAASAIRNDVLGKGKPSDVKSASPSQSSRSAQRSPSSRKKSNTSDDSSDLKQSSQSRVPLIITDPIDLSQVSSLSHPRKRSDSVRSLDTGLFNGDAGHHYFNFDPEDLKSPLEGPGKGFWSHIKTKSTSESMEQASDLPSNFNMGLELIPSKNPKAPPGIWMTTIDHVPLMVMFVDKQETKKSLHLQVPTTDTNHADKIPLLRRLDDGMVNASLLLHAGGVCTEQERSVVLSLEPQRVRYKDSRLRGAWVPLTRAQDLATSLYMGTRVGLFLSDALGKSLFGFEQMERKFKGKRKSKNLMSQFEHVVENNAAPVSLPLFPFPLVSPAFPPIPTTSTDAKSTQKSSQKPSTSAPSHLALQQQIAHNFFSQNPLAAQAFLSMLAGGLDVKTPIKSTTPSAVKSDKKQPTSKQKTLASSTSSAAASPFSIASPVFNPFHQLVAAASTVPPSTPCTSTDHSAILPSSSLTPQPFLWSQPPLSTVPFEPKSGLTRRWKRGRRYNEHKRAMIRDGFLHVPMTDSLNGLESTETTLCATSDAFSALVQSVQSLNDTSLDPVGPIQEDQVDEMELVMHLFGDSSDEDPVQTESESDDSSDCSEDEMNLDAAVRLGASMLASLEQQQQHEQDEDEEHVVDACPGRRKSQRRSVVQRKAPLIDSPPTPPPPRPAKRKSAKQATMTLSHSKIPSKKTVKEVESDFEIDIMGDDGMDDLR